MIKHRSVRGDCQQTQHALERLIDKRPDEPRSFNASRTQTLKVPADPLALALFIYSFTWFAFSCSGDILTGGSRL